MNHNRVQEVDLAAIPTMMNRLAKVNADLKVLLAERMVLKEKLRACKVAFCTDLDVLCADDAIVAEAVVPSDSTNPSATS
jgi:hypothetical protein